MNEKHEIHLAELEAIRRKLAQIERVTSKIASELGLGKTNKNKRKAKAKANPPS